MSQNDERLSEELNSMADTLTRAGEIINGERQDQYGNPEDSFKLIAQYWTTYLRFMDGLGLCAGDTRLECLIELDAADVAKMMTLFKIARMSGQVWSRDNAIDACGYLAILNDRIKK